MRAKKKREEEEELERLLLGVGDLEADNPSVDDIEIEANAEFEENLVVGEHNSDQEPSNQFLPEDAATTLPTGSGTEVSSHSKTTEFHNILPKSNIDFKNFQNLNLNKNEFQEAKTSKKIQLEEPANVWSSLRHLKQSSKVHYETIFSSKNESTDEKVSLNDIDDMIQNLAKKIAEKRLQDLEKPDQPDLAIIEEDQEEEAELKDKESTDISVESDRCLGMLFEIF